MATFTPSRVLHQQANFVVCWSSLQTVWTKVKPYRTSGLIWLQAVWGWKNFVGKIKFWKKSHKYYPECKELNMEWENYKDNICTLMQQNLSSGVSHKVRLKPVSSATETAETKNDDSHVSRLDFRYATFQKANNKGAYQTVQAGLLLCCSQTPEDSFFPCRGPVNFIYSVPSLYNPCFWSIRIDSVKKWILLWTKFTKKF